MSHFYFKALSLEQLHGVGQASRMHILKTGRQWWGSNCSGPACGLTGSHIYLMHSYNTLSWMVPGSRFHQASCFLCDSSVNSTTCHIFSVGPFIDKSVSLCIFNFLLMASQHCLRWFLVLYCRSHEIYLPRFPFCISTWKCYSSGNLGFPGRARVLEPVRIVYDFLLSPLLGK